MAAKMTTRKKRVSKKSKSSWRKHSDVKDVEDFLEEKRIEAIAGGPVSTKKNDELFTIDTKLRKVKEVNLYLTRKERARAKPLKSFSSLENESAIPDPAGTRNKVRLPGDAKGICKVRRVQTTLKRLKKDAISLKDSSRYSLRKSDQKKEAPVSNDLWAVNENDDKLPIDEQWLKPQTLVYTKEHFFKKIGKKTKQSRVKNNAFPAVEAPHPGESYNPSLEDHQNLLHKVVDHERQLIAKEKHLERVTTKMFCKRKDMPTEESKLKELAEGLPVPGEEVVDEDLSDSEYRALNPPVQNKRKTNQKRRKLKEAREEARKKFSDKIEKKKISDIYRLKKLEEEMAAEKVEIAKNKDQKQKAQEKKALLPKQISRFKYQVPELDFNLPKDLKGSIRKMKTEGSILVDRFKSMQKRNVIETRVRQKIKRKFKPKKFIKASHKIDLV